MARDVPGDVLRAISTKDKLIFDGSGPGANLVGIAPYYRGGTGAYLRFDQSDGAAKVGFRQSGAGAAAKTVQDKLRQEPQGFPDISGQIGPPSFNLLAQSNLRAVVKGAGGTWNSDGVGYGTHVVWDESRRCYAMLTTGRKANGSFSIGLYTSTDGISNWTAYGGNPVFSPGSSGQWDDGSVGTPFLLWSEAEQLWHMFYEAFDTVGYELGVPAIGHATASDLAGTWTRDAKNPILKTTDYAWIGVSNDVYHPCVIEHNGTYHLFFNGGAIGYEDVGHASAPSLYGPWTPTANPVIPRADLGTGDHATCSDPFIWKYGDQFYMYLWDSIGGTCHLFYASESEFPKTWRRDGYVNFVSSTIPVRLSPAVINGEFVVFGQNTGTYDTVMMYRAGSVNALGLIEAIYKKRKQFACGSEWGSVDMTGAAGARKAFIALNTGGTLATIGTASGTAGSETEKPVFAMATAAGAASFGFGGATSSFPGAKRSGTVFEFRLGDDSAYCPIRASYAVTSSYAVGDLPAAATVGPGARAMVTDANATTFSSVVAGGGANVVPVYSDGAAWRIG